MLFKDIYNPKDQKITELINENIYDDNMKVVVAENAYKNYLEEIKRPLPSREDLKYESLLKQGYEWMADVRMVLYDEEYDIDKLYEDISADINTEWVHNGMSVISMDLETTGLEKQWVRFGGKTRVPTPIVGIGIAYINRNGDEVGIYIPVNHVNTKNQKIEKVLEQIQKFIQNMVVVFHNGMYDREILQLHGVKIIDKQWADTMLLAIANKLRDKIIAAYNGTVGLKLLSRRILGRTMLEINDVVEDGAQLYRMDGKTVLPYGSADVLNTLQLFWVFRGKPFKDFSEARKKEIWSETKKVNKKDVPYDNAERRYLLDKYSNFEDPYDRQKWAMNFDIVAADYSNGLNRFNYPIKYEQAKKMYLTNVRRVLVCTDKLQNKYLRGYEKVSDDTIGLWMYDRIKADFLNYNSDEHTKDYQKDEMIAKLEQTLLDNYGMTVKRNKLKSGVTKVKVGCGADVLDKIERDMKIMYWLEEETKTDILNVIRLTVDLRTCSQSQGVLKNFVMYGFVDDCPMIRLGAGLKFFGAATTRYTNEGGKGSDRVSMKTKVPKFVKGDGVSRINAQGIPTDPPRYEKARRMIKIPEKVKTQLSDIDMKLKNEVETALNE